MRATLRMSPSDSPLETGMPDLKETPESIGEPDAARPVATSSGRGWVTTARQDVRVESVAATASTDAPAPTLVVEAVAGADDAWPHEARGDLDAPQIRPSYFRLDDSELDGDDVLAPDDAAIDGETATAQAQGNLGQPDPFPPARGGAPTPPLFTTGIEGTRSFDADGEPVFDEASEERAGPPDIHTADSPEPDSGNITLTPGPAQLRVEGLPPTVRQQRVVPSAINIDIEEPGEVLRAAVFARLDAISQVEALTHTVEDAADTEAERALARSVREGLGALRAYADLDGSESMTRTALETLKAIANVLLKLPAGERLVELGLKLLELVGSVDLPHP